MKILLALMLATLAGAADAQSRLPCRDRARCAAVALDGSAILLQVQARQRPLDVRDAAQHAENRQRCAAALRIAALCGKHAGTFRCNDKGFQSIPENERLVPALVDNEGRYRMDQCARRAAQAAP